MYARTITWRISPHSVDELAAHMRDRIMPRLSEIDGFVGLSLLVDRGTGRCISTGAWQTAEALHASDERMHASREEVARTFGTAPEMDDWEIAVLHRVHRTDVGACARVDWSRTDPPNVDRVVDACRESLMPWWEQTPGFDSNSFLVDRDTGRFVSTVVFESHDAMAHTRDQFTTLREEFSQRMGLEIVEVGEFDIALAQLRVPETV
jgi:heme-degrading monooxygenase HmoA